MLERFKPTRIAVDALYGATLHAIMYRLGQMEAKAALSERDRGALELMAMILDEVDRPGVLIERLQARLRKGDRDDKIGSNQSG